GTDTLPGVPDVPTDESKEDISWKSTDDEGDDDEGNDGGDDDDDGKEKMVMMMMKTVMVKKPWIDEELHHYPLLTSKLPSSSSPPLSLFPSSSLPSPSLLPSSSRKRPLEVVILETSATTALVRLRGIVEACSMTTMNQEMSFAEIEQIIAQRVANAIETIVIFGAKTRVARDLMNRIERQEDKVAENASNKRKLEVAKGTRLQTSVKVDKPAKGKQPVKSSTAKEDNDDDQDDKEDDQTDSDNDGDDFVHPKFSTHDEEAKDEESFDPIVQTPSHMEKSDDEGNDDASHGMNVGGDEGSDAEDDDNELYRDLTSIWKVQVSKILPKIEKTVNEQLEAEVLTRTSNSSKTSYVVATDLSKLELKKILIEKMESNKSIHRSDQQKNLYKALVDAYECDKIILDTYGDTVTLKRRQDDEDKDEEPSVRADWGSKKRRAGKEPESTSAPKKKASKTSGKSTKGSKSHQKTTSKSAPVEELINLVKKADSYTSFDELMDTPIDFSTFVMNRLKVDTLTPKLFAGPTYKLMKGSCKNWNNPKGQQYLHDLLKPLPLIPNSRGYRVIPFDHFINNNLEYLHGGVSSQKYTNSVTKTKAADYGHIKWIEDLEAYTAYSNPRGFIYQNKDKQNMLMRFDELHKFSDGTVNYVGTALDDHLKGIRMKYPPQTIWRRSDKERAAKMI
nr:hypothetical protein [Tanacetum cinerariifolium]